MKLILVAIILSSGFSALACPTVEEEAVSVCRAKASCRSTGAVLGAFFGGFGASANHGRNAGLDQFNLCVDNSLSAQRANAHIPETTETCTITQISEDTFKKVCH